MDNKQQNINTPDPIRPVMDVRPPGATPAMPSSKPVFTNDQPLQPDPMMTNNPITPLTTPMPSTSSGKPIPVIDSSTNLADRNMTVPVGPATSSDTDAPLLAKQNVTTQTQPVSSSSELPTTPNSLISGDASAHQMTQPEAMYGSIKHTSKVKKFAIFLLVLLVLGGLGVGAYFLVGNKDTKTPATQQTQTPAVVTETKKDTTYSSPYGDYTFDNKFEWKAVETKAVNQEGAETGVVFGTTTFLVTDAQQLEITIGKASALDACEPKATEKAFEAGNTCASYQLLSKSALSESAASSVKLSSLSGTPHVVTYKVRLPQDGDKEYNMAGISAPVKDAAGKVIADLELNTPLMGTYGAQTVVSAKSFDITIKLTQTDGKPAELSEANLAKVVQVLKTFKLK